MLVQSNNVNVTKKGFWGIFENVIIEIMLNHSSNILVYILKLLIGEYDPSEFGMTEYFNIFINLCE